jgi:dolichyl-phosphate beta-glucosyltransferase
MSSPQHTPTCTALADDTSGAARNAFAHRSTSRTSSPHHDQIPHAAPVGVVDLNPAASAAPAVASAERMLVVLPVYNEAAIAERSVDAIAAFAQRHPAMAFVFADDGSSDQTARIISARVDSIIARTPSLAPRLSFLAGGTNRGKAGILRHTLETLTGPLDQPARPGSPDRFVFIDGDLAYAPEHLLDMARELDQFDVVIGSRHMSEAGRGPQGLLRTLLGVGFNTLSRICLRRAYRDTQAGLKGFRMAAAREIFRRLTIRDFSFDVELLFIARKRQCSIAEMPAEVDPAHRQTPSSVKLLRDPPRMFLSLLRIRLNAWRGRYR